MNRLLAVGACLIVMIVVAALFAEHLIGGSASSRTSTVTFGAFQRQLAQGKVRTVVLHLKDRSLSVTLYSGQGYGVRLSRAVTLTMVNELDAAQTAAPPPGGERLQSWSAHES